MVVGAVEILHAVDMTVVSPRGSTASARLLGDGEGYALVEGSTEEGHLASIGTARDTDALDVDLRLFGAQLLQSVDEAAHAPCPLAIGTIGLELWIKTVEGVPATLVVRAPLRVVVDLVFVEVHHGDGAILEEGLGQ